MALTKTNTTDFDTLIVASSETVATTVHADLLADNTGTVHAINFTNTTGGASNVYLKFFDAQSVTLGTDNPIFSYRMKAAETTHIFSRTGITLSTALSINVNGNPASGHSGSAVSAVSYSIMGS